MKIIVFNVAAETGGALTILRSYYEEALQNKEIEWHFILSKPKFPNEENVYIHNYPWVKKSWFHRIIFDIIVAPILVRKLKGDVAFSLQNLIVPFTKVERFIYFHQLLPFAEKKFTISENFKFWVYQNIIGKLIIKSILKADKVIVQAKWIKDMLVDDYNIESNKINIRKPKLNIKVKQQFETAINNTKTTFFYPASAAVYKNHKIIVDVASKLSRENNNDFEIIFTLRGNENSNISELKALIDENKLPIKFVGNLSPKEVFNLYSKTILLFPSYLETYGLPLEEAKLHNTPIIVSNLQYAKEVLKNYNNVSYFDPFNKDSLYKIIKENLETNSDYILGDF